MTAFRPLFMRVSSHPSLASIAIKQKSPSFVACKDADRLSRQYTTLLERCSMRMEIKKSKFIALAAPIDSEHTAFAFLKEVSDPQATHNCWAYKVQNTYRFNDDGEPGGTAGKPIYSSIVASGLDCVMVVVTRYYGGIKLGTGGLVKAYGGVTLDCLRQAKTIVLKPKEGNSDIVGSHMAIIIVVEMEVYLEYNLLGVIYPLMQVYQVNKLQEEYDTVKGGMRMTIMAEEDKASAFEKAVKNACSGQIDIKWL